MRIPNAALVGALVAVMACQSSDVGSPCRIIPATDQLKTNPIDDGPVSADFIATGVTSCDNLVCIKSPQRPSGYCSAPCASNSDCSQGLVCRPLTYDPSVINNLPDAVKQAYQAPLASVFTTPYCATPQQ